MAVRIEGVSQALKQLDASPQKLQKLVQQAMKEAGKEVVRGAKPSMPKQYARLMKCKVIPGRRMLSGNTSAIVGMFKGKSRGNDIPLWFKAYWANYGTLRNRDTSHQFVYPVKKATKSRRNNEGQPAEGFYENAMAGWDRTMAERFQQILKQKEQELL